MDALSTWLNNGGRRVISSSPMRLFPVVQDGQFDARLYYQLNVICVDLISA